MSYNNPSLTASPTSQQSASTIPARSSGWLKWIVLGSVVLVLAYFIFLRPLHRPAAPPRGGFGGAVPVTTEAARAADLNVRLVALGTVTPVHTVTVRSRVDGELRKIFFAEGQQVEAGAPLAEIDPRPFEVQKMQAEAQLAKDNALLENARVDLKRFQTLLEQDSVAGQQVETQAALVRQSEAAIKLDEAQVESAKLQLAYAHIVSPITGRIGLRTVDQGNMVHAGDANGLAVITQLHPITVLFSIPQDSVPKVMKRLATGEPMAVEAFDRDGRVLLATGRLATVDNQVDPTTGTVKLRAEFPNEDDTLFPNQFVNVQLITETISGAIVVPNAAVQRGNAGTFVYVVADQKTASARPVETGPSEKGLTAISKGLSAGEVVVIDGVDKLHEGSTVEPISHGNAAPAGAPGGHKRDGSGKRPREGAPAKN